MTQEIDHIRLHSPKWRMSSILSLLQSNLIVGIVAYLLTSVPVLIGIFFGTDFLTLYRAPRSPEPDFLTACSRRNGISYKEIVEKGYSYDQTKQSVVAFFPGYPMLARLVVFLTGWSSVLALVVVSNVMLIAAFAAMASFLQARWPDTVSRDRYLVLALLGVFPTSFFCRMAYAESTFLFGLALFLNGTARRWPLWLLAVIAGSVTAFRPVGVACSGAFMWHILSDPSRGSIRQRILLSFGYLPVACSGLLAYMGYQEAAFGNPLAFAQTQENWSSPLVPRLGFWEKAEALLSAEPIWSIYDPDSLQHWSRITFPENPSFSLYFWNPILFVGTFVLMALGWYKHWLSGPETVLGLGLLAIPYVTRSYEMSMTSHGRFAMVVIPAYLTAGRIMKHLRQWAIWPVFGIFAAVLMIWTAFFAAGYYLY